jgi:hypothetical protein
MLRSVLTSLAVSSSAPVRHAEPKPFSGWRAWLATFAALVLLNASVTFENVWPTPKIQWANALSIELAASVLLLALAHRWAAGVSRRVLPGVWVVLVFGHYMDVTAPGLYGREFNLYWDSQHLGNVFAMLARAAPVWLIALAGTVMVAAVYGVYAVARQALGQLGAAMHVPRARRALGTMAAAVILVSAAQQLSGRPSTRVSFGDPVTPAYVRQARFVLSMLGPDAIQPALGPSPNLSTSLAGLNGADVMLVFVESYGAVTYEVPAIADGLARGRADLAAAVRETGREVVTAYVDSPTFGGSSWLAHLSLISGVEVRDQFAYTALMASPRETIITNFSKRGYRTVALMPGMRQAWPEGAFYHFDQIYGRDLLEYRGPEFGWWSIPDQYALAKLDALERAASTRPPLFIVFPTSTTHAPFGPVAPYQRDWSKMLTADAFDAADVERAIGATPDLTNLRPSYVHATAYEYAMLAGYLRQHPRDDMVLIAIGDHQPPAAVSGRGASWSVPVHVFGRRGQIVDRLIGHGFRRGLEPHRPPIGAMHTLAPKLLDAFGSLRGTAEAHLDRLKGSLVPPMASASRPPSTGGP